MLREHHAFYLPNLTFFTNGNDWIGSFLGLRFHIAPTGEGGEAVLSCLTWYGEYCLEESEVVNTAVFPCTDEGREAVIDWLEEEYNRLQHGQSAQTTFGT